MRRVVLFEARAEDEARAAYLWYAQHNPLAAERFRSDFEAAIDVIADTPFAGVESEPGTRRWLLNRFPYGLVYAVADAQIAVIAVAHLHRKPGYWK